MSQSEEPKIAEFDATDWDSYCLAMVGAAAALTGLLFVAVSINLKAILEGPGLSARAAETLATLLLVLASTALALVPQAARLIGVEILFLAVPALALMISSQIAYRRTSREDPISWFYSRVVTTVTGTVPAIIAGLSLALHWGGGFYWLVPSALLGMAGAVYSAWVLLVEIVR